MYKRAESEYGNDSIALLIKIINEAFEKRANRILRQYNLTFSQARILICLSIEGDEGHSLKELEKVFHVTQQTVAGTVSRLEEKGLVTAFAEKNDKRIKNVRLTESGKHAIRQIGREIRELENWLETGLELQERTDIRILLRKLYERVEQPRL